MPSLRLLSLVLMTCLKNGLMLDFNDSFVLNMSIGVLLIAVVLIPNIIAMVQKKRNVIRQRKETAAPSH